MPSAVAVRMATFAVLAVAFATPAAPAAAAAARNGFSRDSLPPLFAEVAGGVAVPSSDAYGDVGWGLKATVGAGAPVHGLPLAVYVTVGFGWTHFADTRRSVLHTAELVQDAYVYTVGLRGVWRATAHLELLVDVAGGWRSVGAAADVDGVESYTLTEGYALPVLGAGARYRFLDWLQAGLLYECQLLQPLEGPDVPAEAAGRATPRGERWQMNVMVAATAEF